MVAASCGAALRHGSSRPADCQCRMRRSSGPLHFNSPTYFEKSSYSSHTTRPSSRPPRSFTSACGVGEGSGAGGVDQRSWAAGSVLCAHTQGQAPFHTGTQFTHAHGNELPHHKPHPVACLSHLHLSPHPPTWKRLVSMPCSVPLVPRCGPLSTSTEPPGCGTTVSSSAWSTCTCAYRHANEYTDMVGWEEGERRGVGHVED